MEESMSTALRRLTLTTLVILVVSSAGAFKAEAKPASKTVTLTVALQQFGPPPYHETDWLNRVEAQLVKSNSSIRIKLIPIVASEGDYYTKVDLMMRSSSTAPDLVREDSFLIGSDVTAGYLAPLDSCLSSWPEYKQQWYSKMQSITTFLGHNYGVMNGTDDRLVWYNKNVFRRAGLPTNWQPRSWNAILAAARTIKNRVKGVIPMNLYSGIPADEASTMQGFEMLLYGTKNKLYDYTTGKWVVSSPGFLSSLNFVQQVYNSANLLGPPDDIALTGQVGNIVAQQLLPSNKLGIDIDGSWVSSNWYPKGAHPWPQWQTVMGHAKMPTQFGGAPYHVTLSGGWAFSVSSRSGNKAAACQLLKIMNSRANLGQYDVEDGQISPRKDVVKFASYARVPLNSFYTSLLSFTQFRPAFPEYPRVSNQVDLAMENVMTGMKPQDAMSTYAQAVTGIVGKNKTERR
jgi:multiple sugar transport system substrate-binding protein